MTEEVWKPIEGFPDYEVSNLGRVRSYKTFNVGNEPTVLKGRITGFGYYRVTLCNKKGGKNRSKRIHRLVAEAFIPNPDNKPEVNHVNGIKTDNQVENLEWCTPGENQKHAYRIGLRVVSGAPLRQYRGENNGENNGSSKLTKEQIDEIRKSDSKNRILADKYGVSVAHISRIKNYRYWAWM